MRQTRIAALLLSMAFGTATSAATLKSGNYSSGNETSLELKSVKPEALVFEMNSANTYRGSFCTVEGTAKGAGPGKWHYQDSDSPECKIDFLAKADGAIEVKGSSDCSGHCGMGALLDDGEFKLPSDDCKTSGADLKKMGALSKAKSYKEAYELGRHIQKDCLAGTDDNAKGALYSDLAFLSYQLKNKKDCLEYVKKGIASMHQADEGIKALKDALKFYMPEEGGCKNATQPGCSIYEERIKIYGWLKHNEKLCAK